MILPPFREEAFHIGEGILGGSIWGTMSLVFKRIRLYSLERG